MVALASRRNALAFALTVVSGTLIAATAARAQVSSTAQVILPIAPPIGAPWNAQTVFEPLLYPYLWDRESRWNLPPEDMPVRTRQQPGYEPIGLRAGSWM